MAQVVLAASSIAGGALGARTSMLIWSLSDPVASGEGHNTGQLDWMETNPHSSVSVCTPARVIIPVFLAHNLHLILIRLLRLLKNTPCCLCSGWSTYIFLSFSRHYISILTFYRRFNDLNMSSTLFRQILRHGKAGPATTSATFTTCCEITGYICLLCT